MNNAVAIHRRHLAALWQRLDSPEATEPGECWVWPGARLNTGYASVKRNGQYLAHRAAWVQVNGAIPEGSVVCHTCDNPPCFRPSHLFVGTQAENNADRMRKGRTWAKDGRVDRRIRLSDEQVEEIRRLSEAGAKRVDVAAFFGVKPNHISNIVRGKARREQTGVTPDPVMACRIAAAGWTDTALAYIRGAA